MNMDNDSTKININIIQWNCQSIRPKSMSLESLLTQEKVHIAVLSETWLEPDSYFHINGYNTFRLDRLDGYGGVAILTHKSVKVITCLSRSPNVGIELLHVKIFNCRFIENIISIYCPSTVRATQNDWDYIFSLCGTKSLILGDFNAHHPNWSFKTDQRGAQIFDCMLDHNFVTMNNGSPTRIRLVNGLLQQSSPDVSFVSSDLATLLSWNVTNETLGSDHVIIKISFTMDLSRDVIRKRNFKHCDWASYSKRIEELLIDFSIPSDLQSFYDMFLDAIQTAANEFIPYIKIPQHFNTKFSPKQYWNPELSKAVAERRLALAIFRRCPSPVNLENLQDKISSAQRVIRLARCRSFQRFCSSIDETSSPSVMWRKMKWMKGYRSSTNNSCLDREQVNGMLNNLAPDYVSPPQPEFQSNNVYLESDITLQEIINSIKKNDTAPGSDEISFSMIKHLPTIGKSLLLCLYNRIFYSGFVPLQWRDVKIVPIPKPNRESNAPAALRPIALISCLCKIFHSVINKRMEWFFEKQSLFPENMVGFRKARSCFDNLTRLASQIQIGFSNNLTTVACFIDIDSAYNNVNISCLTTILDKLGVGTKVCLYLWSYLSQRNLRVSVDGNELVRSTGQGLAQGDPWSPLLFNIATLNICKNIQNVLISQYADDFVLYISNNNLDIAILDIQIACQKLNSMLNSLGLTMSPHKSRFCVFKKGGYRSTVKLSINNYSLPMVNHFKYLGIWLDSALRWGKHINETAQKVTKFINLLKVLAGPGWGLHQKHLRRLYIAIIRSRMDYASFLFDNSCKSNLLKLDRIQNQALRVIGGYIRSTPIHVMESDLYLPPLNQRRRFLAGKFWLKSKSISNNKTIEIIEELSRNIRSNYWLNKKLPLLVSVHSDLKTIPIHSSNQLDMFLLETWVSNINLSEVIIDSIPMIECAKRLYSCKLLNYLSTNFIRQQYHNCYKIFTDGSKEGKEGGAAFLDPLQGSYIKLKIDSDISIMHIELIAIAEALSYIDSINHNKFVILTDSKSSLQHLARCTSQATRGAPIAYRILESILSLQSKNKEIFLQWIPSHIQLKENDAVDLLAKQASIDGVPLQVVPLFSDQVKIVREKTRILWQEYFDERSRQKGIWFRTIQPLIAKYPWIDNSTMNRKTLVTALRLRSAHIPSNKFAFLMKKVPSPNCTECGVLEDVQHILMECVRNESYRRSCFSRSIDVGFCNAILACPMSDQATILYKLAELGLIK